MFTTSTRVFCHKHYARTTKQLYLTIRQVRPTEPCFYRWSHNGMFILLRQIFVNDNDNDNFNETSECIYTATANIFSPIKWFHKSITTYMLQYTKALCHVNNTFLFIHGSMYMYDDVEWEIVIKILNFNCMYVRCPLFPISC